MPGMDPSRRPLSPETVAVAAGRPHAPGDPLNTPPTLTSAFHHGGAHVYARKATPTGEALEEALGHLDGGEAVAYGSGIAAIAAVVESVVPNGGVVVAPYDAYLNTRALLDDLAGRGRLAWTPVDVTDTSATLTAAEGADLVWLESPTNPLMGIADVAALCEGAGARGVPVAVDATFATPLRLRPLALGASVVVHSATKLIGGHSDLLAGVAIAGDEELADALRRQRMLGGAVLDPMSAWLTLRGLRTLPVRLDRAEATAADLAGRLAAHPAVRRVRYPGLASDPGAARHAAQASGPGTVLAFELVDGETADRACAGTALIAHATSLGGVESSMERRAALGREEHVPAGLVRLSVGCEAADDLWADLRAALPDAAG